MSENGQSVAAGTDSTMGPTENSPPTRLPAPRPSTALFTREGFETAYRFCEVMVATGFLPRAVNTAGKALAIVVAGAELGLPPMKSLRSIYIIDGKPVLSAEMMLERFVQRGGEFRWVVSEIDRAELWLRTPRGVEHVERFTLDDARQAGLLRKDNWVHYPKAMLRARCISGGLKALGESEGAYDYDEMGLPAVGAVDVTPERADATVPAQASAPSTDGVME